MPSPALPPPPPPDAKLAQKIDYLAIAWLQPALAPLGFARARRTLHRTLARDGADAVHMISLQAIHSGMGGAGEFYVNLGVQIPALVRLVAELPQYAWWLGHLGKADEERCALRARLRYALPEEPAEWWLPEMTRRRDFAFLVGADRDLASLGAVLTRAVTQYGLPWLHDH